MTVCISDPPSRLARDWSAGLVRHILLKEAVQCSKAVVRHIGLKQAVQCSKAVVGHIGLKQTI